MMTSLINADTKEYFNMDYDDHSINNNRLTNHNNLDEDHMNLLKYSLQGSYPTSPNLVMANTLNRNFLTSP